MELLHPSNLLAWALQAGIVVLVAAPLPRLLGMWSPRARMTYWRVVLVTCLLLPLLQTWAVREAVVTVLEPAISVDVVGTPGAEVVPASSITEIVTATASRPLFGPIGVAQILVAGVLLRLAWLGLGVYTVGRLRRSARRLWPRPPSVDRAATLAETDAEFLVSATASRPVTCGWAWPVVLVPRTFETFPEHEQTAIATHELLHVSRADWVRNAADEILRALLWFHPGIWYVINQIQLAREQVVDREAVRRLGTRQPYLEALLRLAKPAPRLVLTPASLFLKRAHLRQRVTLLVKEVSMSRARLVGSLAVMAVVVFLGGRIAAAAFPLEQSGAKTPGASTTLVSSPLATNGVQDLALRALIGSFSEQQSGAKTPGASTAAAPLLNLTTPMTFHFSEGVSVRQVITFWAQACGVSVTYDPGTDQALNGNIGSIEAKNVTATQALTQILAAAHLSYRVTGERAIVIGLPSGGVGGGVGAARPGIAAGVGSAVPGGVAGGVRAGVAGGVAGGTGTPMADERFMQILANIRKAQGLDSDEKFQAALKAENMTLADLRAALERVAQTGTTAGLPKFMTAAGNVSNNQVAEGDMNFGVVRRADPSTSGASGRALVTLAVTADGSVGDVRAAHVTGGPLDAGLAEAAAAAARNWQFEPSQQEFRGALIGFNFTPENTGGTVNPSVVRIGGNIKPPIKVRDIKPAYPKEAQESRLQGVQILEISVGPSGDVLDARALRAQIPLIAAAMDAVLQWKFTPWDGPERRLMTVTVNFTLDNGPAGMPARDLGPSSAPLGMATPTPSNWPANAIRVGGNVKPPSKIVDVKPVYPKDAQDAKVQGVVILEVLIGEDGTVKDEHILRSIPMLDKAAEAAVRGWVFTPTLLNGNPTPIIMTVTCNFTLQ